MSNKVVLVGLWFALSLSAAISQDVKGQTSQGTTVTTTTGTTASEQTTPNLITSGTTHNWTGVTTGTLPANYMPGGPSPIYDPSTNTVSFSYNSQAVVAQTIAINNALANAGAGVKINGYNYSYDIRNMNGDNRQGGTDTLNVYQNLIGTNGASLLSSQQTYNTKFEWQSVTGNQTAGAPIDMANASYLKFSMVGGDNGYWGGYFGPQVRNVNMSLNYTVDQCSVNPQSSPSCVGFKTYYNISDDGYAQVNLPFAFPFYGRTFTTSYMFSNGVVGFLDPTTHWNGFCCDGVDLRTNLGSPWNFAIYALQTDLIANNPDAKFYTQSDPTYMKYTWEKINEYGTSNLNTFSTTIKPNGYIGINHQQVNVQHHNVTTGIAGDLSLGQYAQYYTGHGSLFPISGTTIEFNGTEVSLCVADPLSSPSCPGYQQAYYNQQCSINPLYDTGCYGYQQAYYDQQCAANSLYDINCPGYAAAYLNYQCSQNPLYSTTCSGYETAYFNQQCTENPLYNSRCSGYDAAYLAQQCSLNPLYSTTCTGYADAYFSQQCNLNGLYSQSCPNYAAAYKTQQCSLDALYATDCPGYAAAYFNQQCSLNPLYNNQCVGYNQAYFNHQCSLNGLYDRQCPNYSEAYAKKMLLEQQNLAGTVATAGTIAANAPAPSTATTDSSGEVKIAVIADSEVNNVITNTATSASPAQAATATVPLVTTPAVEMKVEVKAEAKQEEKKDAPSTSVSSSAASSSTSTETKPAAPTARQELAAKREAAAKTAAVEKGKNLANEMGKAADMEAQKQVQNVVIQAMGYTPGFDAYGRAMIPQTVGYKPFTVYNGQINVDNKRVGNGLYGPSDRLHNDLVNSQYTGN